MIKRMYLSLAVVAATLGVGTAQAASDYLIHVDGIVGTSTIAGFEDYIEVESWSLGFVRSDRVLVSFPDRCASQPPT